MDTQQNKKIVLGFLDDISMGDYGRVLESFADDGTYWIVGNLPGAGMYTKEKIPEFLSSWRSIFPKGIKLTADCLIGEGDYVAVEGHSYAEIADGKIYQNKYVWVFEVKDGKIRAIREYPDTQHGKEVLFG
jgi:uncharacterized protein